MPSGWDSWITGAFAAAVVLAACAGVAFLLLRDAAHPHRGPGRPTP